MADLVLDGIRVGDRLCVWHRHGSNRIETAERITPTGMVVTKSGMFNKDGSLRGDTNWDRTWARPATEDDIAGIYRVGLVQKIERFRLWDKLSADELKAVVGIVDQYRKSRGET